MTITIVGAGIVGCAIAHELASRGVHVRVLDGRGPGAGATRASAGILAPHIEGHDPVLHALCVRSLAMYDEFVRRVMDDADQQTEYARTGTLQVALTAAEAAQLEETARRLGAAGLEHELLDAADAHRLEPAIAPGTVAALHIPVQGYVAPIELTRSLVGAAMRYGATFDVGSALAVQGGDTVRLRTPDGVIESDAVIVAAGSWSASIEGVQPDPGAMKPIRGQILQLRLPERPAQRVIWGTDRYLVPRRDGSILAGATVEDVGFDEHATASGVQYLLDGAMTLMPILRDAVFEEVRVGLRPMTRDELPVLGASSTMPNVFYATGHYRNGVLLAPLSARLVADLVLDRRPDRDLAALGPERLGL